MSQCTLPPALTRTSLSSLASAARTGVFVQLGLLLGIVMPIVAAILYPTWTHEMHPLWVEYTRLTELPFVFCELLVIHLAIKRGYSDTAIWGGLPRDVKVAFGVFAIGLVVSSVLSSRAVPYSLSISLITLIHVRFAAAIFHLARDHRTDDIGPLVPLLGLGLIPLTLLTIWRFAMPPLPELVPGGVIEWDSALPGFINVRHFGSWTGAIAAGLMLGLLYGKERRPLHVVLYALALGLTFWTATRAAVLALAVVGAIALVTLRRLPTARALLVTALVSLAAITAAILLQPAGLPSFAFYQPGDLNSVNAASGTRVALWDATLTRWMDAPLFGWGSGSTFWEVNIGWAHTQPHNFVLQALISWGLVGAAGALWLIGRALGAIHVHAFSVPVLLPLAGVLYALLCMSMLEGMLHYPRFIMAIMIGFAVVLANRNTPEASDRAAAPR